MVLANRAQRLQWGFAGVVLAAPLTRWIATTMEGQPSLCPSQILFNVACPLCGGTRAGLYLISGDVVAAVESNAGAVAFAAAVGVVLASGVARTGDVLGVANPFEPMAE